MQKITDWQANPRGEIGTQKTDCRISGGNRVHAR